MYSETRNKTIKYSMPLTTGTLDSVKPHVSRLRHASSPSNEHFIIDGSKALRSAIEAVFGKKAPVQRCRRHKARNVLDRLTDKTVKA